MKCTGGRVGAGFASSIYGMDLETNFMKFLENRVGHLTGVCFINCNPYFANVSKKDKWCHHSTSSAKRIYL